MATYKRITDVETVAEATENMNVLVEDNGALKKMPVGNTGGNGERIIFYALSTAAKAAAPSITCSHTYQEIYDMYFSPISSFMDSNNFKDLNDVPSCMTVSDTGQFWYAIGVDLSNAASTLVVVDPLITFLFNAGGTLMYININQANSISSGTLG